MKRIIFGLSLLLSAVCLTTSFGGCGASPCETAFQKQKACFASKDCSTLGTNEATCESFKTRSSFSEQAAACEEAKKKAGGLGAAFGDLVSCQCEGVSQTAAQAYNSCELDDNCDCKQ